MFGITMSYRLPDFSRQTSPTQQLIIYNNSDKTILSFENKNNNKKNGNVKD